MVTYRTCMRVSICKSIKQAALDENDFNTMDNLFVTDFDFSKKDNAYQY